MPRPDTPPPRPDPTGSGAGKSNEPTTPGSSTPGIERAEESDRYEIREAIGSGGMGQVYKAFDRKLKRLVALKFVRGADPVQERRFLQEAQAQARVDHAHVCRVYEVGRISNQPYIAMQHIEGKTLREAASSLSFVAKLALMRDVAEAVHAAHQTGLVHRDIKPQNILVEQNPDGPRPFVTDFGLARDVRSPGDTAEGAVLGTPQYMAPEQANGDLRALDARTDVYGLGATLYEVLTARPPFEGGSQLQILFRMIHEDPKPPRKLAAGMPADAESVVLKCLEKDPARRYPTAKALADDLSRILAGEPVQARRPGALERLWRKARRHKVSVAALAALALTLGLPRVWGLIDRGAPLTVAVADFDNQTGDPGLDALSGLLITSLEQSRKLSVVTRSRMFDLMRQLGREETARIDETVGRDVARQANAHALLLGTIRRFDDLYLIELKILEPHTSRYLAALREQGSGKTAIPPLIDKLSAEARRVLRDSAVERRAPVEDVTTRSLEAYQQFFQGEEAVDHLQFARAAERFRAALAIDPGFALAWYRLAYAQMWEHDGPRARDAIAHALQLADKLPEKERLMARGVRGSLFAKGQEAYDSSRECVERWPAEKECAFMLGDVIFHAGYPKHAAARFRGALALDPSMERAHQHLVWSYQLLGEKDALLAAALEYQRRVNDDEAWGHLARAQAAVGLISEARQTLEEAGRRFPGSALPVVDLAALDAWQFDTDAAVARLSPLLETQRARDRQRAYLTMAGALVQGGRVRAALEAFDAAALVAREAGDPEGEAVALAGNGLLRALYLGDADGARRIAREAAARGVPETMFAFVYPLLGDIEAYGRILRAVGDPLADKSVEVFQQRARGQFAAAAAGLDELTSRSPYREFLYYVMADCWMRAKQDGKAIESLRLAQSTFNGVTSTGPGYGGMFRARSDAQLAALYERTGQRQLAAEAARRFLAAWAKADPRLSEIEEARARLARLEAKGDITLR
ncbi:MAG TPA: protein kinase [Myxococcales bacterium]|nr:protein kinase [Myxococcales bacterium]